MSFVCYFRMAQLWNLVTTMVREGDIWMSFICYSRMAQLWTLVTTTVGLHWRLHRKMDMQMSRGCYYRVAPPWTPVPRTVGLNLLVRRDFHLNAVLQFHHHPTDSSPGSRDFCTSLHFASNNGHFIVAELLIQHGADISTRNQNQETPLHLASLHGRLDIVRLLVIQNGVSAAGLRWCMLR